MPYAILIKTLSAAKESLNNQYVVVRFHRLWETSVEINRGSNSSSRETSSVIFLVHFASWKLVNRYSTCYSQSFCKEKESGETLGSVKIVMTSLCPDIEESVDESSSIGKKTSWNPKDHSGESI